jgi:hypothetical protein
MRGAASSVTAALTTLIVVAVAAVSLETFQVFIRTPTDQLTVRIIVVDSADAAQSVVKRLESGEDFATLASRLSIDPSSDFGGLIGKVALSALHPELRRALEGLSVGQLSPVVEIATGFAVLKVVADEGGNRTAMASLSPALAATASVKYVYDLSGYGVATAVMREFEKPADWNQDPHLVCQLRRQSIAASQQSLERYLSRAVRETIRPADRAQLHFVLAQIHSFHGAMERAIENLQQTYAVMPPETPAAARAEIEEALGIAYLHKAELDNGVYHTPGERCLLSGKGLQRFEKTADVEKAIEHFSKYLTGKPDDLEVKWLLNLAFMAMGSYPDKVPPAQLIPRSAFESVEDVGRFVDVAPQSGITSFSAAGGVIVDDFDNDGQLDVVTSSMNPCAPMLFFRRMGGGTFVEQGAKAGVADQVGGLNTLQTDYNNDGYLDILLLRGGWELPQRKSLLRNNGDGTFTDVTVASGLARPATSTQAAVWTDVDRDGFLDLFVGNENSPAQLFLNKRDGTFEDVAARTGVNRTAYIKGVGAVDYDKDGWPDLYASNISGSSFLYHNNHDGTFAEVGQAAGVPGSGKGFATWFFDYDNDGWQDLFATSYFTSVDETARTYLRLPHNAATLKLYRNLRNGRFQDVTREVGLDKVFMPMGANFGDIDNDGFLDIYLGTGNPSYGALVPSVLLRNNGGKAFVDVTASSGTGEFHKGHGVAFADLDHDGDEEIVFVVGGATPADEHALRLFDNPGHGNDWVTLKLAGVKTNRAAIGAQITVTVNDGGSGTRTIHRTVSSGGSFGASPLQQHVGLGKSAGVVDVEVWWPASNTRQRFTNVGKNQFLEIRELAPEYTQLQRPLLRLGGATRP